MIPIGLHTMFNYQQVLTYTEWNKEQLAIAMDKQNVSQERDLNLDPSLGLRTFSFTPKGSLTFCRVKNNITGSILDLTVYD